MQTLGQTISHGGGGTSSTGSAFIQLVGRAALLAGDVREACVEFCEQNRQIAPCGLPESRAEIAQEAGFATMFDLVITYGGRRLYLPTSQQRLFTLAGWSIPAPAYIRRREQADVNGQIDIPGMWGLFLALPRAAIRFALAREWSAKADSGKNHRVVDGKATPAVSRPPSTLFAYSDYPVHHFARDRAVLFNH